MASLSIEEAIKRIQKLGDKVAEQGKTYMKQELASHRRTGGLERSITKQKINDNTWSVYTDKTVGGSGYGTYGQGRLILEGRGEIVPRRASVLHWKSRSGEDVFAMRASATDPDDFLGRTVNKLKAHHFDL